MINQIYAIWQKKEEENDITLISWGRDIMVPNKKQKIELEQFQKKGMKLVEDHLLNTEYGTQRSLIKEINFLIFYTFEVLKDDYFKGDKILKESITKIDDYVFSQYKHKKEVSENIANLKIVAFSNRFKSMPHENLLSYYVFLEETGFEITNFYKDFYNLLTNCKQISKNKVNFLENLQNKNKLIQEEKEIPLFITESPESYISPVGAQNRISEEVIKIERKFLLKKIN